MYFEEISDIGVFVYRMLGFVKQPTDIYARNYYLLLNKLGFDGTDCVAGRPKYSIMFEYIHDFLRVRRRPLFHFGISDKFSHNDNSKVRRTLFWILHMKKLHYFLQLTEILIILTKSRQRKIASKINLNRINFNHFNRFALNFLIKNFIHSKMTQLIKIRYLQLIFKYKLDSLPEIMHPNIIWN